MSVSILDRSSSGSVQFGCGCGGRLQGLSSLNRVSLGKQEADLRSQASMLAPKLQMLKLSRQVKLLEAAEAAGSFFSVGAQ